MQGEKDRTWWLEKILLVHSQTLAGAVGLTWTSGGEGSRKSQRLVCASKEGCIMRTKRFRGRAGSSPCKALQAMVRI